MYGEYKINNFQEIYDSLVQNFEMEVGNDRKKIAAKAKEMKAQLGNKRDSNTKEYQVVLDKIIAEYNKKRTIKDVQDEYDRKKWSKKR